MWPFTRKKKKSNSRRKGNGFVSKIGSDIIEVSSIGFLGEYSESTNGRFILGWSGSALEQGRNAQGSYILAEKGKLLLKGKLQRPNDGKVANNGTFILNDWMFGEGLKGTFYAFNKTGAQLCKHLFYANLLSNAISDDGKYAVCQCANSDTEDSGVLAFFDLEAGRLLWKKQPESGWANSYAFDCENKYLYLCSPEKKKFRYSFDGQFLDDKKWKTERIKNASAFELSFMAKDLFKEKNDNLSLEDAKEILSLLNRALKKGLDEYSNEKSSVYRTIGEVNESLGNLEEAIRNYEIALQINPKVGVKRRLTTLKKKF